MLVRSLLQLDLLGESRTPMLVSIKFPSLLCSYLVIPNDYEAECAAAERPAETEVALQQEHRVLADTLLAGLLSLRADIVSVHNTAVGRMSG